MNNAGTVSSGTNRSRYRRILFFFASSLISLAFWDIFLPRLGLVGFAQRGRSRRYHQIASRFREMAIRLGGVMIKVGQFLSTRVDVLPIEITSELADLQDEVPAERFDDIKQVAEIELGMPLSQKYAEFDHLPLAAASLGQVHRAVLWLQPSVSNDSDQGQFPAEQIKVVVKVQRPNIEQIIQTDLAALRVVGGWLEKYPPIRKRADVRALLQEFSTILFEEIDYLKEGVHAETFAENFQDLNGVYVPRVVWSHTTRRVLTLEDVGGFKITDYAQIGAADISPSDVASRLIDVYLKQIFEDGFFHADPHPGNLFVRPKTNGEWDLTFIDFGMVGRVPADIRLALRELLVGVGTKDPERVVRSYQMLGILLPTADLELIKKAELRIFDRFWGKSMDELRNTSPQEFLELAGEFRQLLYDMPFQIPYNIIFLGRTVGILSGIATGLNPGFNIWLHLAPYAERLISEEAFRFDPEKLSPDVLLGELGSLAHRLFSIPRRAENLLATVERGELNVRDTALVEQVRLVRIGVERIGAGIIFAGALLSTVQFFAQDSPIYLTASVGLIALVALWQALKPRT